MDNTQATDNLHTNAAFSQLTPSQWRFVTAMVEDPSRTKKAAAAHIGITADTVYRWGDHVDKAIEAARTELRNAVLAMRKQALIKAMGVKVALLDSTDEQVRQRASTEIIEWELGKATGHTELSGPDGGPIQIDDGLDDAERDARAMARLDAARKARNRGNAGG